MPSERASPSERAHFERIAAASGPLADERPPASLLEVFERLAAIRRTLGDAAHPGVGGDDPTELEAHQRVLRRGREIGRRGAERTRSPR
jgi:hypothetical protein